MAMISEYAWRVAGLTIQGHCMAPIVREVLGWNSASLFLLPAAQMSQDLPATTSAANLRSACSLSNASSL